MIELPPQWKETVVAILEKYLPEYEILAFGSRVEGTSERYSDLDLVIIGLGESEWRRIEYTKDALSESDLPISVDIVRWEDLPENMRRRVENAHTRLRPARKR